MYTLRKKNLGWNKYNLLMKNGELESQQQRMVFQAYFTHGFRQELNLKQETRFLPHFDYPI